MDIIKKRLNKSFMFLYFNVTYNNELILKCVVKFFVKLNINIVILNKLLNKLSNWLGLTCLSIIPSIYIEILFRLLLAPPEYLLPGPSNFQGQKGYTYIAMYIKMTVYNIFTSKYNIEVWNAEIFIRWCIVDFLDPEKNIFPKTLRWLDLINNNLATKCGWSD